MVDKQGTGLVSKKDLYRMRKGYLTFVDNHANIAQLIKKYDRDKDNVLDASELHSLLSVLRFSTYFRPSLT
jgi:Ca2+-binding EF-hand superfamily protein